VADIALQTGREIVSADDGVSRMKQELAKMRPEEARTASNENAPPGDRAGVCWK
jgi:hypothetical protein